MTRARGLDTTRNTRANLGLGGHVYFVRALVRVGVVGVLDKTTTSFDFVDCCVSAYWKQALRPVVCSEWRRHEEG